MKKTYEEWFKEVNAEIIRQTGFSADDLPDYCYKDAYDDGKSPKSTAKAVIKNAKEY